jgi:hypothetical protein
MAAQQGIYSEGSVGCDETVPDSRKRTVHFRPLIAMRLTRHWRFLFKGEFMPVPTTAHLYFACYLQARPIGGAVRPHPFPPVFFR